jgi:hypothetical protein
VKNSQPAPSRRMTSPEDSFSDAGRSKLSAVSTSAKVRTIDNTRTASIERASGPLPWGMGTLIQPPRPWVGRLEPRNVLRRIVQQL